MRARRLYFRATLAAGLGAVVPNALAGPPQPIELENESALTAESKARRIAATVDSTAAGLIVAFNTGDEQLAAFLVDHVADPDLAAAQAAVLREKRREWGTLDVHTVVPMGAAGVALLARSERNGRWVYITAVGAPSEPAMLVTLRADEAVV